MLFGKFLKFFESVMKIQNIKCIANVTSEKVVKKKNRKGQMSQSIIAKKLI